MRQYVTILVLVGIGAAGCAGNSVKSSEPIKINISDIHQEAAEFGSRMTISTKEGMVVKYDILDKAIPAPWRSYKLGCGDEIEVLVPKIGGGSIPLNSNLVVNLEEFGGMEYTHYQVTVDPMGNINLPLVGEVCVAGLSMKKCEEVLAQKLSEYIVDPRVVVKVKTYASYAISIYGEVRTAGRFEIKKPITLSEALALAGGVGPDGTLSRIYIGRRGQASSQFNVNEILTGGRLDTDLILDRDDVVFVPRESWIRWDRLQQIASVLNTFVAFYYLWQ
jgi:protein involved in polysaccharide export with SLBB domain